MLKGHLAVVGGDRRPDPHHHQRKEMFRTRYADVFKGDQHWRGNAR